MQFRFFPEMDMHNSLRRTVFTILLAGLAVGCAVKPEADRTRATDSSKQRLALSEGYSMLYKDASTLDLTELILYVKVESDAMDKVVTAVAEAGGQMKKDLERIAKDHPGVRIDLDPL